MAYHNSRFGTQAAPRRRSIRWRALRVECLEERRMLSGIALDSTFHGGAAVTTDFSSHSDVLTRIALQSDGKIVAVGHSDITSSYSILAAARYNADGALDTTFGSGGQLQVDFGQSVDVEDLVIQPDGKIVGIGMTRSATGHNSYAVVRYNSNGTLDSTFGGGGVVLTDVSPGTTTSETYDNVPYDVTLQPDGKILVAGGSVSSGTSHFTVVRYQTNGQLDATFGSGGIAVLTTFTYWSAAEGVRVQSDGKIVVGGNTGDASGHNLFAVTRLLTNGTLDTSFGVGGSTVMLIGSNGAMPFVMTLTPDDGILMAGTKPEATGSSFVMVRYNATGGVVPTFGTNGVVTTSFAAGASDTAYGIALQPGGKILLAGESNYSYALARYNSDGSPDYSLKGGADYRETGTFAAAFSGGSDVAVQSDGKIIIAGGCLLSTVDFALVRYTAGLARPEDLLVDFGAAGLWVWKNNSTWQFLHSYNPAAVANADLDGNGQADFLVDFGPSCGLYALMNGTTWQYIHPYTTTRLLAADLNGDLRDEIIVSFVGATGTWVYYPASGAWRRLTPAIADSIVVADLDGNGKADLAADYGVDGVHIFWNDTAWQFLHAYNPVSLAAGRFDANAQDDLLIDFGPGVGLWMLKNTSAWTWLHPYSAALTQTGDLNGDLQSEILVDFGAGVGLWEYYSASATWRMLTPVRAAQMVTGDLDGSGKDELIADLPGYGLYIFANDAGWQFFHSYHPDGMAVGQFDSGVSGYSSGVQVHDAALLALLAQDGLRKPAFEGGFALFE